MSRTFAALSVRNYRIFAFGGLVSNVGTWLQNTAQIWLILHITGNGAMVGIAMACEMLPTLAFSPAAGVLADRFRKHRWMAVLQVAMAVPTGILGILAISGHLRLWHALVLVSLFGVGRAFEAPVRQAIPTELVPPPLISNAVALNAASFNAGRLIGPGSAGLLIAALGANSQGAGWAILANACSYLFMLFAILLIRADDLYLTAPVVGRRDGGIRNGIQYAFRRPDILLLLGVVLGLGAFGLNFQVTTMLMIADEFHLGAREFGIAGSLIAVGSLGGALIAARVANPRPSMVVVYAGAFCLSQVVSGLAPGIAFYLVTMPTIGFTLLITITTANSYIQLTTDPTMRGRIASLYLMVFVGSAPIGAVLVGWCAEAVNARAAVLMSGLLSGLSISLCLLYFAYRRQRSVATEATATPRPPVLP